ncbi:Pex19 protein family-domain-containing protein [Umbelopsis sp. PMI_123]|nr:Pex19 protein family-domain-containing protein [Umbelopsis sp. PMI_123]
MSDPLSNRPNQQEEDPELDDLLDDVLDDFSAPSAPNKAKAPAAPATTVSEEVDDDNLDSVLDDDFAKQLAAGMEELMGGEDQDEFKDTFEKIWKSFESTSLNDANEPESAGPVDPDTKKSFQETIAQTMNKLRDSSDKVETDLSEESEDAFMQEMMKQMESLADNSEFQNMLEGMMNQLMSKELLYEPMKDLAAKYPEWLEKNKDTTPKDEFEKYQQQYDYVKKIVSKYEDSNFDEKDEKQATEVVDLMQKMQELGQPPAEMMDEMAPGMNLGADGMPDMSKLNEQCSIM